MLRFPLGPFVLVHALVHAPTFATPTLASPRIALQEDVVDAVGGVIPPQPLRESLRTRETVRGTIVDSDGEGMRGVKLRVLGVESTAVTDERGQFELQGLLLDCGALFAELPSGATIVRALPVRDGETGGRDATIWDVTAPWRATPIAPADSEREGALALELLMGIVENEDAPDADFMALRALQALAEMNAPLAIRLARDDVFEDESMAGYVVSRSIDLLAPRSPYEALELLDEIEPGMQRTFRVLQIARTLGGEEEVELLVGHLDEARTIEPPMYRVASMARIASRLHAVDETDRALELFEEVEAIAETVERTEWAGYSRGLLGEALATVDLQRGLGWVRTREGAEDVVRHYGNIAVAVAALDPKAAESLLADVDGQRWRASTWSSGVVYGMAGTDRERAERIASKYDDTGYSHLMIARALFEAGQVEAAATTFDAALAARAERTEQQRMLDTGPSAMQGALLRWAPRIAPERVPAALRLGVEPKKSWPEEDQLTRDIRAIGEATAAYFMLDLDVELARVLVEQGVDALLGQAEGPNAELSFQGAEIVWASLARLDPERAVELSRKVGPRAMLAVGTVLAKAPEDRDLYVSRQLLRLWEPGDAGE